MKNSVRYGYLIRLLDNKGRLQRAGGLVAKYLVP